MLDVGTAYAQWGTPFPLDAAVNGATSLHILLGLGVKDSAEAEEYIMDVDYIKYYTTEDGTNNLPIFLQNYHDGAARTLESLNDNGQIHNNRTLHIVNNGNGSTRKLANTSNLVYSNEPGSKKIYYIDERSRCCNAYQVDGLWYEYALKEYVRNVSHGLAVDGDRVYYIAKDNQLKFYQWLGTSWAAFVAMDGSPVYCKSSLNIDELGRVFYIGMDNHVYAWCPTGPISGQVVPVGVADDLSDAGLNVHPCGCLFFYNDEDHNLVQQSWWSTWRRQGVVANQKATSIMAHSNDGKKLYFTGNDHDIYEYEWNYNQVDHDELRKLGTTCTNYDNAYYPSDIQYKQTGHMAICATDNMVFYRSNDGRLWFYFNDREKSIGAPKGNWYKSPINYFGNRSFGPMVFEPGILGKYYYQGNDMRIHEVEWMNADNPVTCPGYDGTHSTYKTDTEYIYDIQSPEESLYPSDMELSPAVSVSPNPSNSSFTFSVQTKSSIELTIYNLNGNKLFQKTYEKQKFVWNAENLIGGIYYYQLTTEGNVFSGKLIKFNQ